MVCESGDEVCPRFLLCQCLATGYGGPGGCELREEYGMSGRDHKPQQRRAPLRVFDVSL
jgi:hypothetical protein